MISCWEEKKKGGPFKCGTDMLVKFLFSFRPRAKEPEDTRGIQTTLRPLREKKAKANNRHDLLYTLSAAGRCTYVRSPRDLKNLTFEPLLDRSVYNIK